MLPALASAPGMLPAPFPGILPALAPCMLPAPSMLSAPAHAPHSHSRKNLTPAEGGRSWLVNLSGVLKVCCLIRNYSRARKISDGFFPWAAGRRVRSACLRQHYSGAILDGTQRSTQMSAALIDFLGVVLTSPKVCPLKGLISSSESFIDSKVGHPDKNPTSSNIAYNQTCPISSPRMLNKF